MKTIAKLGLALALAVGLVASANAGEETVSGKIMCAKCSLKKADARREIDRAMAARRKR